MKSLIIGAALAMTASLALAETPSAETRLALIDATTAIAAGADRHQWDRVRGAFADEVTLDYTSLWGGEPATQPADDVVAGWSALLPGFDSTLHLVTNHTVTAYDGNTATLEADFLALHRIDTDEWHLAGHYTYALARAETGWEIAALTMTWTHETGDRGLVAQAAARTAEADRN